MSAQRMAPSCSMTPNSIRISISSSSRSRSCGAAWKAMAGSQIPSVRHLKKEGEYFACTDFRKPGSKDEYYDIDFWVNQKTGKLQVDNVKIHKVPVQEDGIWTQVPRYTFEGMDFDVTN